MSRAQLLDMSAAPSNVVHMSKMIQVRNVPDEMHRTLKVAGGWRRGCRSSDYIKRELGRRRRASRRMERDQTPGSRPAVPRGADRETIVEILREPAATDAGPRRLGAGRVPGAGASTRRRLAERLHRARSRALGAAAGRRRGRPRAAARRSGAGELGRRGGEEALWELRRDAAAAGLARAPDPLRLGAARQRQLLRRPLRGAGRDARRSRCSPSTPGSPRRRRRCAPRSRCSPSRLRRRRGSRRRARRARRLHSLTSMKTSSP